MATWLEKYAKQLQDVSVKRQSSKSVFDGAYKVLDSVSPDILSTLSSPTKKKSNDFLDQLGEKFDSDLGRRVLGNWGIGYQILKAKDDVDNGRAPGQSMLDDLARLNYAEAGYTKSIVDDFKDGRKIDLGKAISEGWAGLSAEEGKKHTFGDVIKAGMDNPEDFGIKEGAAGFALDILLDPTTYVGAGTLKSIGSALGKQTAKQTAIKAGEEAAIKSVPKLEAVDAKIASKLESTGEKVFQPTLDDSIFGAAPSSLETLTKIKQPTSPTSLLDEIAPPVGKTKGQLVLPLRNARKIVSDAEITGDLSALDAAKVDLFHHEKPAIERIISKTMPKEFDESRKFWRSFNGGSAYTLHKATIEEALAGGLKGTGPKGGKYYDLNRVSNNYLRYLKTVDNVMRSRGIEASTTLGKDGLPLSLHDVMSSLKPGTLRRYIIETKHQIPPSNMMAIGHILVNHSLGNTTADYARKAVHEHLMKIKLGPDAGKPTKFSNAMQKMSAKEKRDALQSTMAVKRIENELFDEVMPKLRQKLESNYARLSMQHGAKVQQLSTDVIKTFLDDIVKSGNDGTRLLDNIATIDAKIATRAPDTTKIATEAAKDVVLDDLKDILPIPQMQTEIKAAETFLKEGVGSTNKVVTKLIDSALDDISKTMPEIDVTLPGSAFQASFFYRTARQIAPHISGSDLRHLLINGNNVARSVEYSMTNQFNKIAQHYTGREIQEAFYYIQQGSDDLIAEAAPRVKQAIAALKPSVGWVFDTGPTGVMARSGIDPKHVEKIMPRVGLKTFKFEGATLEEQLQSWRTWQIKDPIDLMHRMHSAIGRAHSENYTKAFIARQWGSSVPKEGYAKFVNAKGSLARMVDFDIYYPKSMAPDFYEFGKTLDEFAKPVNQNKLIQMYDTVHHMWKSSVTIYRPGHHVRNELGDIWLAWMDGLNNPKYYKNGMKVMQNVKSRYAHWNSDLWNPIDTTAKNPVKVATVKYGRKSIDLTDHEAIRLLDQMGHFPEYSTLEDLAVTSLQQSRGEIWGGTQKFTEKVKAISPFRGKIHKLASATSEMRDWHIRASHFLFAMEKETLDPRLPYAEALQQAAFRASKRVRKWHPDGSDLSDFERRGMRRVFSFYSWVRKATPLVMESLLLRPGKSMAYPKAMHNLAMSQGIDLEGQGYGDPFPQDQLFPEWMSESVLGPQLQSNGSYYAVKPGVPMSDVLDSYFENPANSGKNIMSSVTPALRIPWEVSHNTQTRSGAPITNWQDYILGQVPNASYVTTSVGMNDAKSNKGYESQFDVGPVTLDKKGITALNWLLGAGISDMSKPSYIKSAQFEQKAKKRRKNG